MPCKVYKHTRTFEEKAKRACKAKVRKIKDWCKENEATLRSYSEADLYNVCIASKSEYDLYEFRKDIAEDNESYFLDAEDYEKWPKNEWFPW